MRCPWSVHPCPTHGSTRFTATSHPTVCTSLRKSRMHGPRHRASVRAPSPGGGMASKPLPREQCTGFLSLGTSACSPRAPREQRACREPRRLNARAGDARHAPRPRHAARACGPQLFPQPPPRPSTSSSSEPRRLEGAERQGERHARQLGRVLEQRHGARHRHRRDNRGNANHGEAAVLELGLALLGELNVTGGRRCE